MVPDSVGPARGTACIGPDAAADAALLERIAREISRRHMATPAILFLESFKPMNFVGSQLLLFLDPIIGIFLTIPEYSRFVRLLEDRDTIERLIVCIERAEDGRPGSPLH